MMILQIVAKDLSESEFVDILLNSTYKAEFLIRISDNNFDYEYRSIAQFKFIPRKDVPQNVSVWRQIGSIEINFLHLIYIEGKKVNLGQVNIALEDEPFDMNYSQRYRVWNGTTNFVQQNQYEQNLGYSEITCQIDYEIYSFYGINSFSEIYYEREEIQTCIQIMNKEMNDSKCNFFNTLILEHSVEVLQKVHAKLNPEIQAPITLPDQQQQSFSKDSMFVRIGTISFILFFQKILNKLEQLIISLISNYTYKFQISIVSFQYVKYYDYYQVVLCSNIYYKLDLFSSLLFILVTGSIYDLNHKMFLQIFEEQLIDQQKYRKIRIIAQIFFLSYFLSFYFFPLLEEYDSGYSSLLTIGFILIPQIIHNFGLRTNPIFIPKQIFGFLFIKIAPYLYSLGHLNNISQRHNYYIVIPFSVIFGEQIQYLFDVADSFKIIQKGTLSKKYHYYYKNKSQESEECAICLLNLKNEPDYQDEDQEFLLESKIQIIITPCGHKFHFTCLIIWNKLQLTCPYCRNIIPPIIQ
ncbi:unnamed protein product [Paramecium primaurelia]|uniref:RING-type domain-containing protein n=1 Tax=Paramecium primaurelia TaxID=5886 RepID=A0A8S1P1W2_PARPR|nr:unnamed protein product [Paramecium primaurelia]